MRAIMIAVLVTASALGAAGYAVAHGGAEGMMGRSMHGMTTGGMAAMMDACRDMMQGGGMGTGRPNERWRNQEQKTPPAPEGAR